MNPCSIPSRVILISNIKETHSRFHTCLKHFSNVCTHHHPNYTIAQQLLYRGYILISTCRKLYQHIILDMLYYFALILQALHHPVQLYITYICMTSNPVQREFCFSMKSNGFGICIYSFSCIMIIGGVQRSHIYLHLMGSP